MPVSQIAILLDLIIEMVNYHTGYSWLEPSGYAVRMVRQIIIGVLSALHSSSCNIWIHTIFMLTILINPIIIYL